MGLDLDNLPAGLEGWLATNGLAMLVTLRADGTAHATMVGANWDPVDRVFRIISSDGAVKVAKARRDVRVTLTFADAGQWASFEGTAEVTADAARVATAVAHYESRFRTASDNPTRVAIEIRPARVLGRWG